MHGFQLDQWDDEKNGQMETKLDEANASTAER
jgi:hypothetical protein